MANLEETHEAELDAILGELSLLEQHAKSTTTTATTATVKNLNMNGIAVADHHGGSKTINNHLQNGSTAALAAAAAAVAAGERNGRTHSRSNSTISGVTNSSISISSESGNGSGSDSSGGSNSISSSNGIIGGSNGSGGGGSLRESRTDSPDNDSAFSDTVSLLSSESSASSNISNLMGNSHGKNILSMNMNLLQVCTHRTPHNALPELKNDKTNGISNF